jgi:hypothetical protein
LGLLHSFIRSLPPSFFLPLPHTHILMIPRPGNHYSMRAEHEKVIEYFRRATPLDRTYLSAWTLMGHEYVEMKNPHAATEAYRRAVGGSLFLVLLCFCSMVLFNDYRIEV